MIALGQIVQDTLTALRRETNQKYDANVRRWVNQAYFELAELHSWHALRSTVTIDFTTATDETGLYLPGNLIGIDVVKDEHGTEFVRRDQAGVEVDEWGWRYAAYHPEFTSLFYADDAGIVQGSNTVTSDLLAAETVDYTDEWIRFGTDPTMYQLSSNTAFSPDYNGPTLDEVEFHIRPPECQKLILFDSGESALTDRSATVYYWRSPLPLYRDSDMMLLPSSRPIILMVLIKVIGTVSRKEMQADRYRGELKDALAESKRLNPDFPRKSLARDKHNRLFEARNNIFGRRGRLGSSGLVDNASLRDILRR